VWNEAFPHFDDGHPAAAQPPAVNAAGCVGGQFHHCRPRCRDRCGCRCRSLQSGVVVATAVAAAAVAVAASGGNLGPLVAACAGADAGAGGQRSCTVASMEKGLEDQPRIAWKESGRGVANSEDGEAPTSRPQSSNGPAGSQAGNRRERGRTSSRSSIKDPRSGGPPGPGSGTPRNTTGDGGRPRLPRGGLGARATRADQLLSW